MRRPITFITSSGIVRDAHVPRVGITCCNDDNLDECSFYDLIDEFIQSGVPYNLSCAQFELQNLLDNGEITEEEFENRNDDMGFDSETYYLGYDFEDGELVERSESKIFATYNTDSNIVSIIKSDHVAFCRVTSPCYMMANGAGPCGDLGGITANYEDKVVIAYCLPPEFYKNEELVHEAKYNYILARKLVGVEVKTELSVGDLIDLQFKGRIDELSEALAINLNKVLSQKYRLEVSNDGLDLYSIVESEEEDD